MGVHRTCGEPDDIEPTPTWVELNGSWRVREEVLRTRRLRLPLRRLLLQDLLAKKNRNVFRVGKILDFVWPTTRTMHPHGAYARGAKLSRIDSHWGGIERPWTRTRSTPSVLSSMHAILSAVIQ